MGSTDISTLDNVTSVLDETNLRDITSFEDALKAFESSGVAYEVMSDYGTGFDVLPNEAKNRLVGVPIVILEWRFTSGDHGEFVSAAIVTKHGEKLILNDGSTGIMKQLQKITRARVAAGHAAPQNALAVPGGLTRSDYPYTDDKGEVKTATTYYLSESTKVTA